VRPSIAVSAANVKEWFDYALDRDDPRPNDATYAQIADDLRKLVNRYKNQDLPPEDQLDVQPADVVAQAHIEVMDAANRLLFALDRLAEVLPESRLWTREADGFPYAELATFLRDMDVSGYVRVERKPGRGQPKAGWHQWGHSFAQWVEKALLQAGYARTLNRSDPAGVVATIGACMVKFIEGDTRDPAPATFAAAMSGHRKSRGKEPEELFPHRNRLLRQ
jgi:hypothetical protein